MVIRNITIFPFSEYVSFASEEKSTFIDSM